MWLVGLSHAVSTCFIARKSWSKEAETGFKTFQDRVVLRIASATATTSEVVPCGEKHRNDP